MVEQATGRCLRMSGGGALILNNSEKHELFAVVDRVKAS